MQDKFILDGCERLLAVQQETLRQAIAEKYAAALASANIWRRIIIRYRMTQELRREMEKAALKSSPNSLWLLANCK